MIYSIHFLIIGLDKKGFAQLEEVYKLIIRDLPLEENRDHLIPRQLVYICGFSDDKWCQLQHFETKVKQFCYVGKFHKIQQILKVFLHLF